MYIKSSHCTHEIYKVLTHQLCLNKSGRKRLYTVWFNLFGILENGSTDKMEIDQCFPGPGGEAKKWLQRQVGKHFGEMYWNDTEMMKHSAYWL